MKGRSIMNPDSNRHKLRTTRLFPRFIALLICIMAVMPLFSAQIVSAVVPKPVLTDGGSNSYADNGKTIITGPKEVFITPEAGAEYFYIIVGYSITVDVYYDGITGKPVNSYYNGSKVNGALVTTLGENPDRQFGNPVGPADNWKITVPAVDGRPSILKIIAYHDNEASEVFTHTFQTKASFSSSLDGSGMISIDVCTDQDQVFNLYLAVYTEQGTLVYVQDYKFTAYASVGVDVSGYPIGEYKYKVFCWNEDYIPLFDAISHN